MTRILVAMTPEHLAPITSIRHPRLASSTGLRFDAPGIRPRRLILSIP